MLAGAFWLPGLRHEMPTTACVSMTDSLEQTLRSVNACKSVRTLPCSVERCLCASRHNAQSPSSLGRLFPARGARTPRDGSGLEVGRMKDGWMRGSGHSVRRSESEDSSRPRYSSWRVGRGSLSTRVLRAAESIPQRPMPVNVEVSLTRLPPNRPSKSDPPWSVVALVVREE